MNPGLLLAVGLGGALVLLSKQSAGGETPPSKPIPGGPPSRPDLGKPIPEKPGKFCLAGECNVNPMPGDGDGMAWANSLPKDFGPAREKAILQAVKDGMARIEWAEIVHSIPNVGTIKLWTLARTLRIGQKNPVRVSCNYLTMQEIADWLGAAMMTSKIADLTMANANLKLRPQTHQEWMLPPPKGDLSGSKTYRMIDYSTQLDKLVPVEGAGLVANESKHWVNTARFWSPEEPPEKRWPPNKRSANYGWWKSSDPNAGLWQSVGLMHDWAHVDYSQQIVLVSQRVELEGFGNVHLGSVLKHPKYHKLVSKEGPLPSWAHPAFGKTSPDLVSA